MDGLVIGGIGFAILFGLLFVFASCFHYANFHKKRYSFKNMFPCEFTYKQTFINNFYGNTGLILSIFGFLACYIAILIEHHEGLIIALSICGIFSSIATLLIVFVPIGNIKPHIFITVILFVFNLASAVLVCFVGFIYHQELHNLVLQIIFYIGLVLTFASLIIITNPRLSLRINAVEKIDENGNKVYERPRYIPLALSQWFIILMNYLIIFCVVVIFFSL